MLYNLTYLTIRPQRLSLVLRTLPETVPAASRNGTLIGCLSCDIGGLNRIAVLAAYEDLATLRTERSTTLRAHDPFGVSDYLSGIETTSFKPLSFAQDIVPGEHGPFYEVRTYEIAPGGLAATESAWSKAIEKRTALSPLMMVMSSVDTVPTRMVHFWPYKSLNERAKVRAEASRLGIWPPPGGADHLLSLRSEIFVPLAFSPLK